MCKALDRLIEHPELLEDDALGIEFCRPMCDGCYTIMNWQCEWIDLPAAQFLLVCIEKKAELEVTSSDS